MKGADPCVNASLLDGGTSCACEVSLTDKYGPSLMLMNTKLFRNIESLRIKKTASSVVLYILYYTAIDLSSAHHGIYLDSLTWN